MAGVEFPSGPAGLQGAGFLKPPIPKDEKKARKAGLFSRMFAVAEKEEAEELGGEAWLTEDTTQSLDSLLDGVTELGDELKKNASLEAIKAYKQAVRRFMSKVIRESYETKETVTGMGFKKRKKYTMIRVIDDKLEQLAMGILHHQKDQLEILRRLDEIRGLLVDLMQ
jgi:uncharacterized protein YaaR (DUF327 family)